MLFSMVMYSLSRSAAVPQIQSLTSEILINLAHFFVDGINQLRRSCIKSSGVTTQDCTANHEASSRPKEV